MGRKVSNTRQELFDNTINRFNSKNRSADDTGEGCHYWMKKKGKVRRCAIGVELTMSKAEEMQKLYKEEFVHGIFNFLPKRLQDMGVDFLDCIQRLHDTCHFWTKEGISEAGQDYAKEIADEYNLKYRHGRS